jgi:hypothetical protein
MPEHTEIKGDHYILPRYWAKAVKGDIETPPIRRIYLELWSWDKKKVLDLGFIIFDHPELMYKPNIAVAQQIKWMEIDEYVNENKASLANIGLYGIEGALLRPELPPLSYLVEHVLKHAQITDDPEDEVVDVEWEQYTGHMIDARTECEWQPIVLVPILEKCGLKWYNGITGLAQVEAVNKAGKKWIVKRHVEKEHKETNKTKED